MSGRVAKIAGAAFACLAAAVAEAALPPLPKAVLPEAAGLRVNEGRVVKFMNPLPRMECGGVKCGTYNNWELAVPGVVTTLDHELGDAMWSLRKVVWADRRLVFVDGRALVCQLNWIRDHIHQEKAFCHWERDLTSFLDFILDTQRADGQFYELLKQIDDVHWSFVAPDCRILYPEDNQSLVRLELEADIEYLMVEGCLQAWRATGDDAWLERALPRLEKGIDYQTSDPKRWDAEHGLCRRPYTIDTWDFTADPDSGTDRRIDLDKPMAVMHGDNTGVYRAMEDIAWIHERFGRAEKAAAWRARAAELRANMMRHLWNGRFFCHQLPLNCAPQDGNETNRLSLSMSYALNRGVLTVDECRGVIEEFMRRRKTTKSFAEWFTCDPPYEPRFGHFPAGQYVNGGVSPFTAGELAKGAFANGYEAYGWDIVSRLVKMIGRDDGRLFFLYHPVTGAPQGRGPSAWGAAAVLSAIDQGLAGIRDADKGYAVIDFSPRWPVTEYRELRYVTGYEVSGKYVDCRYVLADSGLRYLLKSPARRVNAHILLPKGREADRVLVNGAPTDFALGLVGESAYADLSVEADGTVDFEILFK